MKELSELTYLRSGYSTVKLGNSSADTSEYLLAESGKQILDKFKELDEAVRELQAKFADIPENAVVTGTWNGVPSKKRYAVGELRKKLDGFDPCLETGKFLDWLEEQE